MLLTKIPFYKETIIASFSCEHCGYENNEIQPAAEIEQRGCKIQINVLKPQDLNRRVVKSDRTSVRFVELDFEIPAESQKGEVTTIESIIDRATTGLNQDQPVRRIEHPELAAQIDEFVKKLENLKETQKFTIILEDISGNCRVENPYAPNPDPDCTITHFIRTKEQNHALGMFTQAELNDEATAESNTKILQPIAEDEWPLEELHGEVLQFDTNCPSCSSKCDTNMKVTNIPHFKDVVIMSTNCDICGLRTNEVKSGGGIGDEGIKFTVNVNGREDMSRDVLKVKTFFSK